MLGYTIVGTVGAVTTFLATFLMRWLAPRIGTISLPGPRSVHTYPTPSLGGASSFLGFLAALATASQLKQFSEMFDTSSEPMGLVLAAGVMFVVGALDDLGGVSPPAKVAGQVRMTDLQAAVGLVQLGRLDAMVTRRRELAARYVQALGDIEGIRLPRDPTYGTTNFQSFCVGLPVADAAGRDRVMACMADRGVATRRGIMATHLEPAYRDSGTVLPMTERIAATSVVLPLFHEMTDSQHDRVVEALHSALLVRPAVSS